MASTDLFESEIPPIEPAEAERLAALHFGLRGAARRLSGERDQNFHLVTGDGPGYVFKIHPPAEDPGVVDMQIRGLQHIAQADPGLAVPRVIPALDGATAVTLDLGASRPQLARVLSYLPGAPLETHQPLSTPRLRSLGATLGRLDRALLGFEHASSDYELLWDVQRAGQVRAFFEHIPDPAWRALAEAGLDRFETVVAPALRALPRQVIHNDANPYNVLYDERDTEQVGGVLDFGDMLLAPAVQEIAVAASYNPGDSDVLGPTREITAAFVQVLPQPAEALALIPDLVTTRAVLSMSIASWHMSFEPEERDFYLGRLTRVADRLGRLLAVDRAREAGLFASMGA